MSVDRLSARDVEIARECLSAAVHGPFFPDAEFHTLIGLERDQVGRVLAAWPDATSPEDQDLAVNNVLNNLLGYPHGEEAEWPTHISVPPADVAAVLARWRGENELEPGPRGYVDRLR